MTRTMTSTNDLEARLRWMITQIVQVPEAEIRRESSLYGDLGLDSIAAMELLSMIDEELELDIEMEETVDVTTFGAIVDLVERHLHAEVGVRSAAG